MMRLPTSIIRYSMYILVSICLWATPVASWSEEPQDGVPGGGVSRIPATPPDRIQPSGDDPEGILALTVEEAVVMMLQNNRSLVVERINPAIQKTFEAQEQAAFDPRLQAEAGLGRDESQRQGTAGRQAYSTDTQSAEISLEQYFPTGTTVGLGLDAQTTDTSLYEDAFSEADLAVSVRQSLLRHRGRQVNLVRLRQSRLETDISQYELRGFSEALVAQVENAYWNYGLARRRIDIMEESLKLSEQQLSETREMIAVGTLAEAELAAAQAQVAVQRQGLINARSTLAASRLKLLRLLNPPGEDFWDREIILVHQPVLPEAQLQDVADHVATALVKRPEINQAQLGLQVGDLEVVYTRNGLLPKMDLFITLGKSGYADSFGGAVGDLGGDDYHIAGGLSFEYPFRNRSAGAQYQRAALKREQAEKAMADLVQLVALDVRTAYIEVGRTREQVDASRATRRLQEENLRIETEKFRVGRSTSLLVAQVQRDYLGSRINEVEAVVNYLKALTDFYRLEGSLLERRGIEAPGGE